MNDPKSPLRLPPWLAPAVVVLLTLQLSLLWIQGGLIHRQHRDLQDLRDDIQSLTDSLDQSLSQDNGTDSNAAPMRARGHHSRARIQRARNIQESQNQDPPAPEEERTKKELEASRESAKKAVSDAREVQSKLSIEENARKAEEKQKLEAAQNTWQKWVWAALGLGLVAMIVRSWLRRRG